MLDLREIFGNFSEKSKKVFTDLMKKPDSSVKPQFDGSLEILILDRSGSMSESDYPPSRLDGAKMASKAFVKNVKKNNPENQIAVISFSSTARIECMPLSTKEEFPRIISAIEGISTDGFTAIGLALKKAESIITKYPSSYSPRIVLLTDGLNNEAPDPIDIAVRIKEKGVQIDVIGIGGSPSDVDEDAMRKVASVISGVVHYWFIKDVPSLVRKFEVLALREIK